MKNQGRAYRPWFFNNEENNEVTKETRKKLINTGPTITINGRVNTPAKNLNNDAFNAMVTIFLRATLHISDVMLQK